jgi:hypothetical protein
MRRGNRRFWGILSFAAAVLTMPAAHAEDSVAYTIRNGDTLLGLTAQYLTGAGAFETLVRVNAVPVPDKITPGSVIRVPVSLMRSVPLDAKLASFKGDVRIEGRGKATPPKIGMAIREGDVLQTEGDGFATILLSNGSRMTLPTRTRVRVLHMREFLLTKTTDFDFMVDKGRTELSVTPAGNPGNLFRLRTPIAVSAVRGTQFRIGYDNQDAPSLTEVVEGKVAVDAGAEPAVVPAGYGAAASAGGKVGTEELLPAPVIRDAGKLWRARMLDFEVVPVATARGYHLQLARDAAFEEMVAEARSATPRVQVAGIDDGPYFVRAMAIAPSGLEGLTQSYPITRTLAPLIGSVTALDGRRHRFTWETDGRGTPVFRFQLFSDVNREIPVIDEAGLDSYATLIEGLSPGGYSWRVGMKRITNGVMDEYWTDPEVLTVPGKGQ